MRICYWHLGEEACCRHYSSLNQSEHQEDVPRRDMSQDPRSRRLSCETSQVLPCCLLWCLDKNYCVDPRAARTRMASIKSPSAVCWSVIPGNREAHSQGGRRCTGMPPKLCFVCSGPPLPPLYSMTRFVITSRSLWPAEVSEELCLEKTLSPALYTQWSMHMWLCFPVIVSTRIFRQRSQLLPQSLEPSWTCLSPRIATAPDMMCGLVGKDTGHFPPAIREPQC